MTNVRGKNSYRLEKQRSHKEEDASMTVLKKDCLGCSQGVQLIVRFTATDHPSCQKDKRSKITRVPRLSDDARQTYSGIFYNVGDTRRFIEDSISDNDLCMFS